MIGLRRSFSLPSTRTRVIRLLSSLLLLISCNAWAAEPEIVFAPFSRAATNDTPAPAGTNSQKATLFLAVTSHDWVPGLVPIFAIEKDGRRELRRHPALGQENFSEPLFFALPPEDEPEAAGIAGRWEVTATKADGSKPRLAAELASDREKLAGRLDQNTDYRFAYVTEGFMWTNRLELKVKYINDEYRLTAERQGERWLGRWAKTDDSEGGALELHRGFAPFTAPTNQPVVGLYECRRNPDQPRIYLLADEPVPADWTRNPRPLGRVWRRP